MYLCYDKFATYIIKLSSLCKIQEIVNTFSTSTKLYHFQSIAPLYAASVPSQDAMKTFTTLLLLIPAFVLASPAQNEIHISKAGAVTPDVNSLAEAASTANQFLAFMTEEYAKGAACCDQTPCFMGCPVGGVPRVSF
jgi:hypothetical protein